MLSPKARRNILRIVPFGIMWLVFSIIYIILEKGLLGNLTSYPTSGNPYFFERNISVIPLLALLIGILIGVMEIFYFSKSLIRKSFTKKILYKSFIYLLIILIFLFITFITTANDITHKGFWFGIWSFFTDYSFLGILIYIASIIVVTQFYTEVSESMGTTTLSNFFLGKYYRPVVEERIFMFLDMKSSTEIAEKLGHEKYFIMLQEYFSDLSDSVIEYSGEIYQYAGDEMILTWKLEKGINNNCINCFFAMKESLQSKAESYIENFGVAPRFKAGLHCGKVTTGEIGVLKKEIIFTGDVLNATARIEGLCNQYNVDILLSGCLIEKLDLSRKYEIHSMGENILRGKDEKIELFTLSSI